MTTTKSTNNPSNNNKGGGGGWFEETLNVFKSASTSKSSNHKNAQHRFSDPTRNNFHSLPILESESGTPRSIVSDEEGTTLPSSSSSSQPRQPTRSRPNVGSSDPSALFVTKDKTSGTHPYHFSLEDNNNKTNYYDDEKKDSDDHGLLQLPSTDRSGVWSTTDTDNSMEHYQNSGCLGLCGTTPSSSSLENNTIRVLKLQNAKLVLRNTQLEQAERQRNGQPSNSSSQPFLELEPSDVSAGNIHNRSLDGSTATTTDVTMLQAELNALRVTAERHKQSNQQLLQQLDILQKENANMSDSESTTVQDLKQQLADLQFQMSQAQFENKKYQEQLQQRKSYEETVVQLQQELRQTTTELERSHAAQSTKVAPFDVTLLDQRDTTIAQLRQQVVEYSTQLTQLQQEQSEHGDFPKRQLASVTQQLEDLQQQYQDEQAAHALELQTLQSVVAQQQSASKVSSQTHNQVLQDNRTTYESLLTDLRSQLTATRQELKQAQQTSPRRVEATVQKLTRALENSTLQVQDLEGELLQTKLELEQVTVQRTDERAALQQELATQVQTVSSYKETIQTLQLQLEQEQPVTAKHNNNHKSRQIQLSSSLDTEDTAPDDDDSSYYQRQIKERDDAITSLVSQSMEQDRTIADLQEQLDAIREQEQASKDNVTALRQLREEADVFAGQVIELDDEIEQLKSILAEREHHALQLSKELMAAKSKANTAEPASKIQSLEAELDETKEAKNTLQDELRSLRKLQWKVEATEDELVKVRNQVRSTESQVTEHQRAVESVAQEKSELQSALERERQAKRDLAQRLGDQLTAVQKSKESLVSSLQTQLQHSRQAYDDLRASPSHMTAADMEALHDEIAQLKQSVKNQQCETSRAKETIQELEMVLDERNAEQLVLFEGEKQELLAEIESLSQQLQAAHSQIVQFQDDVGIVQEFKEKLERADEAREESEKSIIETYDRKISLLTLDRDVTIDKLRKELQLEKETSAEEMEELTGQLREYQLEISNLSEEMKEQIESREARIVALESTLSAQEQLVSNMKTEMDHLQGSMEGTAARRKEEIDEMQQELLSMTAAAAKQDRELESLKLELESKTAAHKTEVAQLQEKIEIPEEHRNAADLQMELRVKEVKDRLEKLKWRNTSLKEENMNLKERLQQAEALSKENEYPQRIVELQQELANQNKRVKELESELHNFREPPSTVASPRSRSSSSKKTSSSSTKPPVPVSPSRGRNALASSSPSRRLGIFGRKRSVSRSVSRDRPTGA